MHDRRASTFMRIKGSSRSRNENSNVTRIQQLWKWQQDNLDWHVGGIHCSHTGASQSVNNILYMQPGLEKGTNLWDLEQQCCWESNQYTRINLLIHWGGGGGGGEREREREIDR